MVTEGVAPRVRLDDQRPQQGREDRGGDEREDVAEGAEVDEPPGGGEHPQVDPGQEQPERHPVDRQGQPLGPAGVADLPGRRGEPGDPSWPTRGSAGVPRGSGVIVEAVKAVGVEADRGVPGLAGGAPLLAQVPGDLVVEEHQPAAERQPRDRRPRQVGEVDVEDPQRDDGLDDGDDARDRPADPARRAGLPMLEVTGQFPLRRDVLVLRQLPADRCAAGPDRRRVDDLVGQVSPPVGRGFQPEVGGREVVEGLVGGGEVRRGQAPAPVHQVGDAMRGHHALQMVRAGHRVVPHVPRAGGHQHARELPGDRLGLELAGGHELAVVRVVGLQHAGRRRVGGGHEGSFCGYGLRTSWQDTLRCSAACGSYSGSGSSKPTPIAVTVPTPCATRRARAASARCWDSVTAGSRSPKAAVRPTQSTVA